MQKASISAVVTVPISMTVLITQVRIPIVTDWPGIDLQEHPGFVNAEFIDRPVHTSKRNERVILYFHGGAYALCSPRTHRHVTSNLAKSAQARVLSVDYRLAPKHVYPAALIDALSSYRYLLNKRFQPEQVSFAGDSSGGGLATALMLFLRDTSVMPLPGCVALISPWLDLTQSLPAWHLNSPYDILPHRALDPAHFTEERCNLYTSHDRELTDHYVSPIFSRESEVPLCPVLIHVGEAERPRDDSILFATQRFPNANIDVELYEDQPHVFQAMVGIHAIAKVALQRMGVWIQQRTGKSVEIHKQQQKRHVRVSNKNGYPVTEIKHLGRMLDDGCDALVQLGIWQHDADRLFLLEY